jgi:hypothetical protein
MLRMCGELLPVLLLSGLVLYEKHMENIALSPLGKIIAVLVIVYYVESCGVVYGLFSCLFIIVYYVFIYRRINNQYYVENFATMNDFRSQNCKNDVLLHKGSPVKTEMVEHIYPDIQFSNEKCNPCSETCEFSIVEQQLQAAEMLHPKTSDDFSLNTFLEKIGEFVPALWVKSEPFALLSTDEIKTKNPNK